MTPRAKSKTLQTAQQLLQQAASMIESVAEREIERTAFAANSLRTIDRKPYLVHARAQELKTLCRQFDEIRRDIR